MEKSKVYYTTFRTTVSNSILQKLRKMLITAGINDIEFSRKLTALKVHFGERGNMAFIRAAFIAEIVKLIKENEGLPFLTDTNTLYKGSRDNAVDHLDTAVMHGFNVLSAGCNAIIADGLKGTEFREIEINQKNCKTAKIGSAIADADIIISINHFKGHEMAGFGGCLKNIGMGSGSVGGKLEMHSDSQPKIDTEACTACKLCEINCAHNAVHINSKKKAEIDYSKCTGCGQCVAVCRFDAAQVQWDARSMQEKMMEYAYAAVKDKHAFHINFIMDVSPNCDCWPNNDAPIVPNIGILASFDPVAIDKASADLVNAAHPIASSIITEHYHEGDDKFKHIFPKTDWNKGIEYAVKIGLGQSEYEMIEVK